MTQRQVWQEAQVQTFEPALGIALGEKATRYIGSHVDLFSEGTFVSDRADYRDLGVASEQRIAAFVRSGPLNNVRRINKLLIAINRELPQDGLLVLHLETLRQRLRRFLREYPRRLVPAVRLFSFILHGVFPKLPITKRIYFAVTKGQNRRISEVEALGRLYYCGFELVDRREIDGLLYVVARKTGEPKGKPNPSYGPLFSMKRVGKGGRLISVYKLRTMHPYSEYLREFAYAKNGLDGCRVKDDFRVTGWGQTFRRLWVDELPMLVNLLKGDLKLVGGRPLSEHHESLYPAEVRERRRRYRPGLIPPFYADLPATFEETVASEVAYLDAYERAPWRTDMRYLARVCSNILMGRARSN